MTRGEMKTTIRLLLGETVEDFYKDSEIHTQIDIACLKIASEIVANLTYAEFHTTAYNDPALGPTDPRREGRYPLPPNFMSLKDFFLKDGSQWYGYPTIRRLSFDRFFQVSTNATGGLPRYYKVERGAVDTVTGIPGDLWMWPYPDKDYLVRLPYYKKPTKLADDNSISEILEEAHLAACYHAAMIVSRKGKDRGLISEMSALWTQEIETVRDIVGRADLSGSIETVDVYGDHQSE